MAFLDNYEASKERNLRWVTTFPQGRLEAHIMDIDLDKGYIMVQAKGWRNQDEIDPAGIDYAYGFRSAYTPNMQRWFVEDTVTSALMRVMALIMGGADKATREVIEQVETMPAIVANAQVNQEPDYWATKFGEIPSYATAAQAEQGGVPSLGSSMNEIKTQLGGQLVNAAPICPHGHMLWKTGEKNGRAWGGYMCVEKVREKQCKPVFYTKGSDGQWKPQS